LGYLLLIGRVNHNFNSEVRKKSWHGIETKMFYVTEFTNEKFKKK